MDNLSGHERAAVRAIEGAGCSVAYRPPDRPDDNPIGLALVEIKARFRAAEPGAIDEIERCFDTVHEAVTPDEGGSYIRRPWYTATHCPEGL